MEVIDLSHAISPEMPVFPGDPVPCVDPVASIEREGFATSLFTMGSHTGTHMDAPAHVRADAPTLDALSASSFVGSAVVVDCRDAFGGVAAGGVAAGGVAAEDTAAEGATVGMECITRCGQTALEAARAADFLLFDFGWGVHWGSPRYFEGYPHLGMDVVEFAIETGKKAVGFDAPSVDPFDDAALTRHHALLTGGVMIIENLKCPDRLHAFGDARIVGPFLFAALPLKVSGSDGAPVRAIAVLQDQSKL